MIEQLLKNKIPEYAEIEIFFFEHCNLRCVHCFQNHESEIGMNESSIMSKITLIETFFNKTQKEHVTLNIMGGELFQDHIMEKFLPIYSNFIHSVNDLSKKYNKIVKYNFVTNLLTSKKQLFSNWLDYHNLKLSVSYDLSGRFNASQIETFKKNIEIYKDYISIICFWYSYT